MIEIEKYDSIVSRGNKGGIHPMYDNDFQKNQYHYGGDNLPHDDYRTSQQSSYAYQEPWEGKKTKKKGKGKM